MDIQHPDDIPTQPIKLGEVKQSIPVSQEQFPFGSWREFKTPLNGVTAQYFQVDAAHPDFWIKSEGKFFYGDTISLSTDGTAVNTHGWHRQIDTPNGPVLYKTGTIISTKGALSHDDTSRTNNGTPLLFNHSESHKLEPVTFDTNNPHPTMMIGEYIPPNTVKGVPTGTIIEGMDNRLLFDTIGEAEGRRAFTGTVTVLKPDNQATIHIGTFIQEKDKSIKPATNQKPVVVSGTYKPLELIKQAPGEGKLNKTPFAAMIFTPTKTK